ncbi:hypothetical protein LGR54_21630 [Ancylobacter sp. Lp-2]|uniref:hypothetical protein n=1 Tax=Ancylobacter sp. Lp-2 TaxID=2881339 RepID=UPI001E2E6D41|nr:hypothetical protein [Ancylobacter sp. Lp-2]MCB4771215.1 hypothetical protein [Ancylobacter sp. Lp-2]
MEVLKAAVTAVVAGDMNGLPMVLDASHAELRDAAANLAQLSVSRAALVRVLREWRCGAYNDENVQQWASFIRRGYVAGRNKGAIHPIVIEYDANDEELIARIIGRLDDIGDRIDGFIDKNEQVGMLRALEI